MNHPGESSQNGLLSRGVAPFLKWIVVLLFLFQLSELWSFAQIDGLSFFLIIVPHEKTTILQLWKSPRTRCPASRASASQDPPVSPTPYVELDEPFPEDVAPAQAMPTAM